MTSSGYGGLAKGTADPRGPWPTWPRAAVVVAALLLTFFVARNCQQAQIRVSQDQAIATATEQVGFEPTLTQIRLLRQGLDRQPFWFVSLSIPVGGDPNTDVFRRLTLVKIDANTGRVEGVDQEIPAEGGNPSREGRPQEQP